MTRDDKWALIAVDVQRDFMPDGALAVPHGDEVPLEIVNLAHEWLVPVIATRDWHPKDHESFAVNGSGGPWPVHCVRGTAGAEIDPEVRILAGAVLSKGMTPSGDGYSAFEADSSNFDLAEYLRKRRVDGVVVTGLALDYCVKATALDAAKLGFKVQVPLVATRPVDRETGEQAVRELRAAGVDIG